jgi:hypothetical protein
VNKMKKATYLTLLILCLLGLSLPTKVVANFRFVSWGDSRDNPGVLASLSTQVKALPTQPAFTIFNGDLCASWSTSCIQSWVGYLNGSNSNGMSNITFAVRGNHDSGSSNAAWSSFFSQSVISTRIGATNYSYLSTKPDLTYAFDYQNVHFVGIDLPGGDVSSMDSGTIAWLNSDLTAAESRGVQAEFLFWHGPPYYMDGHASTPSTALVNVLNNHPKIMAIFNGHEHLIGHVTLNQNLVPGLTSHTIEEFITGTAGAPAYSCSTSRSHDFCNTYNAFATIDVLSGTQFTVSIYKQGVTTPQFTQTYTKGVSPSATPVPNYSPTPTPTRTPTPTPTKTPTPTLFLTPTPSRIPTPTPTRSPSASPTPITSPTPTSTSDIQPSLPLRAMFYYPWFPESWTQNGIYPFTKYHPDLGFYDTSSPTVIARHLQAMQYAKVAVGISSWWGQGHYTDTKFPLLLRGADGTSFRWAIYYEPESQGNPTNTTLTSDITYIKNRYGNDPNYFRINGRMVVFVYADATDNCSMVDRWHAANTVNAYVVLKVFAGFKTCANQPDSWHQYSPAVATDYQAGYSYSISPSFDKYGEATRLTRDLNRFYTNVASMVNSGAPFQLVTTFNEWGEGSAVEGATEWPSASGYGPYLDALHTDGVLPTHSLGDFNLDGHVDFRDHLSLLNSFGTLSDALNLVGTNIINVFDFNKFTLLFGR